MALTKAHNRMIADASFSVKDYGAVGDGVADDTAAIQAADTAAAGTAAAAVELVAALGEAETQGASLASAVFRPDPTLPSCESSEH